MYHIIVHGNGEVSVYALYGDTVVFLGRGVPPFDLDGEASEQFRAAWYHCHDVTELLPYAELEADL